MYKLILLPLSLLIATLVSFNSLKPEKEIVLEKKAYQLKMDNVQKGVNLFSFNTVDTKKNNSHFILNSKWEGMSVLLLFIFLVVNLFVLNVILKSKLKTSEKAII